MPFASPESFAKQRIAAIQDYSVLSWHAIANIFSRPRYWADIYTQMDSIGVGVMERGGQLFAVEDFSKAK